MARTARNLDAFGRVLDRLPTGWLHPKKGNPAAEQLTTEKVRARLIGHGDRFRFLPITESYTQETEAMRRAYRFMIHDPVVKAALLTKVLAVASLDPQVHPASERPVDKAAGEFVKWAIQKQRGGIRHIALGVLLGGLIDGFSVCEKVWVPETTGRYAGKWRMKVLKAKDTDYAWLLGDDFRNVLSVQDRRTTEEYSPTRFTVWSHLPLFETPTGMSDLRAAYRAFWLLDTAWTLRAIALDRYTLPTLKGTYTVADTKQELEDALAQIRSQAWFTIPAGAQIEALNLASMRTDDFKAAIQDLREDIVIGISGAVLQTLQGQVADGRGDSKVHKATSQLLQWYLAAEVGDVITDQIAPDLTLLNFEGAEPPRVTLGGVDDAEMAASITIDQGLLQMQLPLSKEEMYKRYGRSKPASAADALMPPPPTGAGPLGVAGLAGLPQEQQFADGDPAAQGQQQPDPQAQTQQMQANTQTSSAVADLQKSYTKGDISRGAAVANAVSLLGLDRQMAEQLFPDVSQRPGVATPSTLPPTPEAQPALEAADSGVSILTASMKPPLPVAMRDHDDPSLFDRVPPPKPSAASEGTVAGPEQDAHRAEALLENARRTGAQTLARLAERAATRLWHTQNWNHAKEIFTPDERAELARSLAATNATADLLGRSRIRLRQLAVLNGRGVEHFAEGTRARSSQLERARVRASSSALEFAEDAPTDFSAFAEGLHPLAPLQALAYFRRLIPTLNPNPSRFVLNHQQQAFALARATDETLLAKVKAVLDRVLATGHTTVTTPEGATQTVPQNIAAVLTEAGIAPKNPAYPDMVYRTNIMSALNRGSTAEMQDPEVADLFPVWRYAAITDGRARPHHAARNGTYWPNSLAFEDVRGRGIENAASCRCVPVPVSRGSWARLQAAGARIGDAHLPARTFAEDGKGHEHGQHGWFATKSHATSPPLRPAYGDGRMSHVVGGVTTPLEGSLASTSPPVAAHAEPPPVPDLRQKQSWDCGAAALDAALQAFGIHVSEDAVLHEAGTNPDDGTPPDRLVAEARYRGLQAEPRHGMTLADLAAATATGRLVLCCVQQNFRCPADGAMRPDGTPAECLPRPLDAAGDAGEWYGHWLLVKAVEPGTVHVQDPFVGERAIPEDEFLARWHDSDVHGNPFIRYGISLWR